MKCVAPAAAVGCGRIGFDPPLDAPPPIANRAFVTSTQHASNLGGLAGGDAICMQREGDAGLDGTYIAWLSTAACGGWTEPSSENLISGSSLLADGGVFNVTTHACSSIGGHLICLQR